MPEKQHRHTYANITVMQRSKVKIWSRTDMDLHIPPADNTLKQPWLLSWLTQLPVAVDIQSLLCMLLIHFALWIHVLNKWLSLINMLANIKDFILQLFIHLYLLDLYFSFPAKVKGGFHEYLHSFLFHKLWESYIENVTGSKPQCGSMIKSGLEKSINSTITPYWISLWFAMMWMLCEINTAMNTLWNKSDYT